MKNRKYRLHDGKAGAALTVRVVPSARKTEIQEIMTDGTLKIRVAAPPTEGKANKKLIEFLSDVLRIPKTNFEIIAGTSSKDKLISFMGIGADDAHKMIMDHKKSGD